MADKRKQALYLLRMPPPASLSRHSIDPEAEWSERAERLRETRAYTHPGSGEMETPEGEFPYKPLEVIAEKKRVEGFKPTIYKDTSGIDTIGYGHQVTAGEIFDKPLTEKEASALLERDLDVRGMKPALEMFPGLEDAPENVRGTLANMVFNGMMTQQPKDPKTKKVIGPSPLERAWAEYRKSGDIRDITKYMDREFDSGKYARGNEKRLLRYKKALKQEGDK